MKIVMYGPPLGVQGAMTEIPFLLNGKIERIYKDAVDLQDLECDIAIANFSRDPVNSGNETGWNYLRLPKVKIQLCIQAEFWSEYIPAWAPNTTQNFDGSICYEFNRPFWDCDESAHPCFAKSCWDELGIPIKPRFYFDPLLWWNDFYTGPVQQIEDYGYVTGSRTVHRDRIVNNNDQFKYIHGSADNLEMQQKLHKAGLAFNIHKFDIEGKNPETDGKEVKAVAKNEAIRLSYFYNLGMAIVTEKLGKTFPERLKHCIKEIDDIDKYKIEKKELLLQAQNTFEIFTEYHDLNQELDNLIENIKKEFNL